MAVAFERNPGMAEAVATDVEPSMAGVTWAAVAAGAVANLALTFLLLSLAVGLGLSAISPWGGSVAPTTFKIGTGLYFIVMAMIASSIGGYIAGRLRTKWTGVHTDEVYFRDTAHGFLSWAFALVLGVLLLSGPAASIAGGGASGLSQSQNGGADKYASALLITQNPPANVDEMDRARTELSRILAPSMARGGDIAAGDRPFIQALVAARTGLSPADADKRVSDVSASMKSDLDNARKVAAQLAIWLVAAMIIGAFCASLAATEGGGLRDGTWRRSLPQAR